MQGGDGSSRWATRGAEEAAQRIPVAGVEQAGLPRAQDALLLQARERALRARYPATATPRLLPGNVSLQSNNYTYSNGDMYNVPK